MYCLGYRLFKNNIVSVFALIATKAWWLIFYNLYQFAFIENYKCLGLEEETDYQQMPYDQHVKTEKSLWHIPSSL